MARYRKVDPRIWNDQKFRTLTDDGKLAFLLLLTHPQMTALGAMRGTLDGLAAELKWPAKRMRDAMSDAIAHGMVVANQDASFLGLPKFLNYNEPEGPNSVTKAWLEALDLVPECVEKTATISRCRKYLDGKSDAFKHAIGHAIWDAFEMPCPIQEQEQEQEQEKREKAAKPARKRASRVPEEFQPDLEYARSQLPDIDAEREAQKFRDWEFKTPRSDWAATWRNWIGTCRDSGKYARVPAGAKADGTVPLFAGKPMEWR